ncbi:MAG: hypothetical protein IKS82_04825 [Bacteroidales bacterium]|nr:hypothetical protein [Bacteroidales bacterium]
MKRSYFLIRFLLLLFAIINVYNGFAQSTFKFYDDISLPQTDAWNFVRQGEVSPSMYTGTINLSVPIYEYKDKDFNIPIVATYSSNGNTPNQLPGILGPGWNLSVGGCITVETNGIPDYGENQKHIPGFFAVHDTSEVRRYYPDTWWRFMFSLLDNGAGSGAPEIVICPGPKPTTLHTGEMDAQPDIFHFTLPGHSGSFHLDFGKRITVFGTSSDRHDYRVEIESQPFSNPPQYGFTRIKTITIITGDGFRYIFDGRPDHKYVDLTKTGERNFMDLITAWHLTRIEAPDGRWAEFTYETHQRTIYNPRNSVTSSSVSDDQFYFYHPVMQCYTASGREDGEETHPTVSRTSFLSSISFSGGSHIDFAYDSSTTTSTFKGDQYRQSHVSTPQDYLNTFRLKSVSVYKDSNPVSVASATFSHERNTNGGKTNYLQSITVQGIGTYSFNYIGWNDSSKPYPFHATFAVDHWGYYNGKSGPFYPNSSVILSTQKETIHGTSRDPDASYSRLGMIEKITYPTGGYTTFEYEPHTYSAAVSRDYSAVLDNSFSPRLVVASGQAGGVRIRRISSFLSNGTPSGEKTYTYDDAAGKSSGILAWTPRYRVEFVCKATDNITESSSYSSSSLQDYGFADIEYRSVTEHLGDGTRSLNVFTSSADGKGFRDELNIGFSGSYPEKALLNNGNVVPWQMGPDYSLGNPSVHRAVAPLTSFQSQRGLLKEKRTFKNDTTLSASAIERTSFLLDSLAYTELPCYLIRRFSTYLVFAGKHLPKTTESIIRTDDQAIEKKSRKSFTYNGYAETTRISELTEEGDSLITEYTHLRDLPDSQQENNIVFLTMKRKNILHLPLEERIYRRKAGESQRVLISGRRCTYNTFSFLHDTLILPVLVESYDLTGQTWKKEAKILSYDNFGNITQLEDSDGNTVSYLWSSDGQYLILQAKGLSQSQLQQYVTTTSISASTGIPDIQDMNLRIAFPDADITTIRYLSGVGPNWMKDASGTITEYTYTRWGKLKDTKRYNSISSSPKTTRTTYSNDN